MCFSGSSGQLSRRPGAGAAHPPVLLPYPRRSAYPNSARRSSSFPTTISLTISALHRCPLPLPQRLPGRGGRAAAPAGRLLQRVGAGAAGAQVPAVHTGPVVRPQIDCIPGPNPTSSPTLGSSAGGSVPAPHPGAVLSILPAGPLVACPLSFSSFETSQFDCRRFDSHRAAEQQPAPTTLPNTAMRARNRVYQQKQPDTHLCMPPTNPDPLLQPARQLQAVLPFSYHAAFPQAHSFAPQPPPCPQLTGPAATDMKLHCLQNASTALPASCVPSFCAISPRL